MQTEEVVRKPSLEVLCITETILETFIVPSTELHTTHWTLSPKSICELYRHFHLQNIIMIIHSFNPILSKLSTHKPSQTPQIKGPLFNKKLSNLAFTVTTVAFISTHASEHLGLFEYILPSVHCDNCDYFKASISSKRFYMVSKRDPLDQRVFVWSFQRPSSSQK